MSQHGRAPRVRNDCEFCGTNGGVQAGAIESRLGRRSNLVSIESVDTLNEVEVGQQIPVTVTVSNSAQFIEAFTEPDSCVAPNLFEGYRLDVNIIVNNEVVTSDTLCVPIRASRQASLVVPGPVNTGTVEMGVEVVTSNTGNIQADTSRTVSVVEQGTGVDQDCPPGFTRDADTGACTPSGGNGNLVGGDVNDLLLAAAGGAVVVTGGILLLDQLIGE